MVTIKDDYTKGSVNIPFVLPSFFDIFIKTNKAKSTTQKNNNKNKKKDHEGTQVHIFKARDVHVYIQLFIGA
jgi:hypothetical protein